MTVADDKVTPFPTPLEQIGRRIDSAWRRVQKGDAEWVDGSLELAQALAEGREQIPADQAFKKWLKENNHDHVSHQDRAALINLANDPELARYILTKTESRSYRLIWKENESRFTSVGKPDKPKRGRKKGHKSKPRQTAPLKDDIIAKANDGLSSNQIAAGFGIDGRAIRHELSDERARLEGQAQLLDAAALKNFTEKGALRIEDAIRIHTARLNKLFEQRVNEEVRRRIDAADDAMRANYKKLHLENINLQRIVGQYAVFTKAQFRQMQMLCHPDNSASAQTRAALSQILIENERRLVKPED